MFLRRSRIEFYNQVSQHFCRQLLILAHNDVEPCLIKFFPKVLASIFDVKCYYKVWVIKLMCSIKLLSTRRLTKRCWFLKKMLHSVGGAVTNLAIISY